MPETVIHELEVGEAEIRGAMDRRHRVILPDWELIEIDALGDQPPPAPPLAWEGSGLMAMGMGDQGPSEPAQDDDWDLVELLDPNEDDPEPSDDLLEWPGSEDDWELEELETIGENPAEPEPSPWSGMSMMAMGVDGGGEASSSSETPQVDDDWQLESLALDGQEDDNESEDVLEEDQA
jgi:hypothetical protein